MDDATHEADGADRHPTGEPSEGDSRKGQPPRRSRVGSFRVGLMIHETSVMHPLLTVTLMSDGSVIVSPRAQSSAGWLVAISRCATAGVGFGKVPMMWDQSVRCPGPKAPRLNYHQSGIVTAKDTSHGEHLRLRLPAIPDVDALQIFTFRQGNPASLPPQHEYSKRRHRRPERGDLYVVSHHGPPPAVQVTGVLFAESSVPNWADDLGRGDSTGFVRGRRVEYVVSLQGHGHPLVLVVRPKIDWRHGKGFAGTVLAGVCAIRERPSDTLAIASLDGYPVVPMMRDVDIPTFPQDPSERSDAIHLFNRKLGTPPTPRGSVPPGGR